jgi:selenocysteine lyase/cysteine desulfurase
MTTTRTRREWLQGAGAWLVAAPLARAADAPVSATAASPAGVAPVAGPAGGSTSPPPGATSAVRALPDKAAFGPMAVTYLDSGSQHPLSLGARAAVERYLAKRALEPGVQYSLNESGVLEKFARLINADRDEVAYVPSTTAGEHLVLRGLGLPQRGAHVVTDTLHFFGSFYLYEELEKQGTKVTWLRPVDGRIRLDDVEKAVRRGTKLVAVSSVSTFNGFEHDLKRVCEIAHARGALVYADIIHSAGAVPFDVKATGVDFAACASYKWLMGDFGLGFLYVKREHWDRFRRTQWGYYGLGEFRSHVYPFDAPGATIADYAASPNASGLVALGTHSHTCIAMLDHSLDYLQQVGVARIQAHAAHLTGILKRELPRLGYTVVTPPESRAPIVTCVLQDARKVLSPKLDAAQVKMTVAQNRFRVTTSVFNDEADVAKLLDVLRT